MKAKLFAHIKWEPIVIVYAIFSLCLTIRVYSSSFQGNSYIWRENIHELSFNAPEKVLAVEKDYSIRFEWSNNEQEFFCISTKRIPVANQNGRIQFDLYLSGAYNNYSDETNKAPYDCVVFLIGYDKEGNQVDSIKENVVFDSKRDRARIRSYRLEGNKDVVEAALKIRIGCINPNFSDGFLEISNVKVL